MKPFSREEMSSLSFIFLILLAISFPNFVVAVRKGRDATRKNDLGALQKSLDNYHREFGEFPQGQWGKIMACTKNNEPIKRDKDGKIINYLPCEWGKDDFMAMRLPRDPKAKEGYSYLYLSNSSRYQLYGTLEGTDEPEYDSKIVKRGLGCESKICNFGRAFSSTPLDKSIEEYENELYAD